MAYGSSSMMKSNHNDSKSKPKMNSSKPKGKINPSNDKGKKGEISQKEMARLIEHSKQHKGGMMSKHMRNMIKMMKEGISFAMAHKKAMAMDKK